MCVVCDCVGDCVFGDVGECDVVVVEVLDVEEVWIDCVEIWCVVVCDVDEVVLCVVDVYVVELWKYVDYVLLDCFGECCG